MVRSKIFKKMLVVLLCMVFIVTLFTACGKTGNEASTLDTVTSDTSATVEQTAPTEPPEPQKIDFGGETITMSANWDMTPVVDTPEGVERSELQKAAEEKYNVKIAYLTLSNEEFSSMTK